MPRPKRTKVTPSVPAPLRITKPSVLTSTAQREQEECSPVSSARGATGSDSSDGLLVSKKLGSRRRSATAQQYTMSGALPPEDIQSTRSRDPSGQAKAAPLSLVKDVGNASTAAEAAARKSSGSMWRSGGVNGVPPTQSGIMRSRIGKGTSAVRNSLQPSLMFSAQGTPRVQSSLLGAATFKKRPRAPSLLQMVQSQNIAPDLFEDGNEDLDDFRPDDESTPRINTFSLSKAHGTSSSSQVTSCSRKRKLASPKIQVPASQPLEDAFSSSADLSQSLRQGDRSFSAPEDILEPILPRLPSTHTPQPEIFSDTLAPPQSSSPVKSPPRTTRAKTSNAAIKSKTGARTLSNQSPSASSPLSSSSSPTFPAHTSPRRPLKPLTTATLQNLLPRRRARPRAKSAYDIPSSSDVELDTTNIGEDEDELSFHATSRMRKKKSAKGPKSGAKGKENAASGGKGQKFSRTYTRKRIVDSGSEESGDGSGGEDGVAGGKEMSAPGEKAKAEMKRLAEKFREVDEYTLDFEDMTGSSSQMKDAR